MLFSSLAYRSKMKLGACAQLGIIGRPLFH